MHRSILITGGAGFIGTNIARSHLADDDFVHIFDNLSRAGVEQNVAELREAFPGRVQFTRANVRDTRAVRDAIRDVDAVYHLAAQVAVTTSLDDPMGDLETNILGTVNVLEAVRHSSSRPTLLFTSTNKVYGALDSVSLREAARRYEPVDGKLARFGVSEDQPLTFLSPYGCSKGSADQYVLDYARSYGIPAAVFRMSCIYGTYQLGSEDQGWVAHFLRQAFKREPITIYGDGKQVRDLLFAGDLVRAMRLVHDHMNLAAGEVFNIGGGPSNSTSLVELIDDIQALTGNSISIEWGKERVGDQRWFVADTLKIRNLLGWSPEVGIREGLRALANWYAERPALIAQVAAQVA